MTISTTKKSKRVSNDTRDISITLVIVLHDSILASFFGVKILNYMNVHEDIFWCKSS